MAGSYNHVTDDDSSLAPDAYILERLDTMGDVVEAIEEMYGMIWYLAKMGNFVTTIGPAALAGIVEEARENYQVGLAVSPTARFKTKE